MGLRNPGPEAAIKGVVGTLPRGRRDPPGRDHQGSGTLHRTQLNSGTLHHPWVLGLAAPLPGALERGKQSDPFLQAQRT